ncbi:PREDICTED: uncharacterized protein LOC104810450 [Tarenaya hassleriana]|uniref:uncharacterized protein LOC104810450 n=1 Tax=Tarenaya hassleriana TaxID=28532 RepID=UPI00053CA992|nr:PREDICTED: uncharacterized protein LOC104810450 [Tarenaya hassleriana]
MGQRNIMVDLEMQQQSQGYVQPEPCIFLGSFPQPDIPGVIPAAGNIPNLEAHPQPEPYDGTMFYGIPQHSALNFYPPYVAFHAPPNHLPSSSSHGMVGVTSDEYERNAHFTDHTSGPYKRKNAEGTPGNSQYLNSVPAPLSTTETVPFSLPQFWWNGRSRTGAATMDPVLSRGQNSFIQGNYAGQPFPLPGSVWFDQHQMSNGRSDGSPLPWSQAPSVPYMPGSGSRESGSRNPAAFIYPSPLNPRHHYFNHHPSLWSPIQGVRGHNATVYPPMAMAAYRVHTEMGSTHVRPVQPAGLRTEAPLSLRQRGFPHLRVMPADEVALLEVGDFYDAGNYIDHHRDMRLDIEDMSYEELLALSERIGTVKTGLSEEKIHKDLKTRTYVSAQIKLEEATPTDSCTICQEGYMNQEKIGTLDCGHEYHADCLKKWLFVKNVCPICKSEAIAM